MCLRLALVTVALVWWWLFGGIMARQVVSKRTLLNDLIVDLSTWTEEKENAATRAIHEQQHFSDAFPTLSASSAQLQKCWAHTLWFLVCQHDWPRVDELQKVLEFHTSRWLNWPRASSGELQVMLCMVSSMVQQMRFKMLLAGGRRRRLAAGQTARAAPVDVVVALQTAADGLQHSQVKQLRDWCVLQCSFVAGAGDADSHFAYLVQLGRCSYVGRTARLRAQRHAPGPVQRWSEHTRELFRHRTLDNMNNRRKSRYVKMMSSCKLVAPLFMCIEQSCSATIASCESSWIHFCRPNKEKLLTGF
eukprot:TRINITY_DN30022_c0_g1_i1.p1 TRINITY_DN30022_c0_g1~~TRINITY_DN30022_c0_g1_i1.p1  ORF type:complete len:304 (+),score=19.25 TRINITY_DN30022_c0_g1_i1:437-1348(+)